MGVFFSVEGQEHQNHHNNQEHHDKHDSHKKLRTENEEREQELKETNFSQFLTHFDLSSLLNVQKPYFNYEGGLTTPDCSEIIEWIVFKEPISISHQDFQKFKNWVYRTYPIGNARILNPINKRRIYKKNMN